MTPTFAVAAAAAAAAVLSGGAGRAPQALQQPTFRAGTELVAIDAAVVDDEGRPVPGLRPEDFVVTVDGQPRRVASADFVAQATPRAAQWTFPPAHSSNDEAVGARLVLLAVDQANISTGGGRLAMRAAGDLVNNVAAGDRVGVFAFPRGRTVDFTTDRPRVVEALQKVVGTAPRQLGVFYMSVAEAVSIERRDFRFRQQVMDRECATETGTSREICERSVEGEARGYVAELRDRTAASLAMLRAILAQLSKTDGAKVLVWVSEGLLAVDRHAEIGEVASQAVTARTTIYVIHLDPSLLPDASISRLSPTIVEDRNLLAEGLEVMAGASRGAVMRTGAGAQGLFQRIAREMSAYYLLSIEPAAEDRDGRAHDVRVRSARPGITVRARRRFVVNDAAPAPVDRKQQVRALLQAPLVTADLPMRAAAYPMVREADGSVRVLIGGDIGRSLGLAEEVAVGFSIADANGRLVESRYEEGMLDPIDETAGAALQHTTATSLPPGRYVLRLAAVDAGGRRGSVEHAFTVPVVNGTSPLSALVLAPAYEGRLRVAAAATAGSRGLQAYAELDPAAPDAWEGATVTVDVLDRLDGDPLASAGGVIRQLPESDRLAAQAAVPTSLLPPGEYLARLSLREGERRLASRERPFVLARPVGSLARRDIFANEANAAATFSIAAVLAPALVERVLRRALEIDGPSVTEALRQAVREASSGAWAEAASRVPREATLVTATMLRGLHHLHKAELELAAAQFRAALRVSPEFLPAIVYLGSCYAAGGRAREAAAAWQTALVSESDDPIVFRLAADAWLRAGDGAAARALLDEAHGRWPADREIARRLALAHGMDGTPLDGLRLLGDGIDDLPLRMSLAAAAAIDQPDRRADVRAAFEAMATAVAAAGRPVPPLVARWLKVLADPEGVEGRSSGGSRLRGR